MNESECKPVKKNCKIYPDLSKVKRKTMLLDIVKYENNQLLNFNDSNL